MRLSNIALYDKNTIDFYNQGLGILSDAISSESTEAVQDNGNITYEMTLKYPINGVLADKLKLPNLIRAQESEDPNDFMIFEIYDYDEDDDGEMTVYAQALPYRVLRLPFNDEAKFATKYNDVQELFDDAIKRVTGFPTWFKINSDVKLASNLNFKDSQFENLGKLLEATMSLIDATVEYQWNQINILQSRGRDLSNIVLRDDKNTNGVKITGSYEKIINKVVPIIKNRNETTGEFEDGTHMGSVVTSKDPFKWIPYYAGVTAAFDSQEEANNYISSNKLDNPAITVDVTPLMVDEDLTQVHTFDRITAYSTKLKYQDTLQVTTRVFDQLNAEVVSFKMGSIKKDINSTTSYTLSSLASEIARAQNIARGAARSADGKNTNYYAEATPADPIEGDLWFHKIDGKDIMQQYINGEWTTIVKDGMGEEIQAYVDQKMLENDKALDGLNTKLQDNDKSLAGLNTKLQDNDEAMDKLHTDLESNTQTIKDNKQAIDDAMGKVNENLTQAQADVKKAVSDADLALANAKSSADASGLATQTANAASDAANAAKQLATEVSNNFVTVKTQANQAVTDARTAKADANTAKINATQAINDAADAKGQAANALGQANTAISNAADALDKFNNMQIGGTNLITGTSGPFVMGWGIPDTTWDETNQVSGISLPVTAINARTEVLPQGTGFPYTWMPGVTYTQSIYISTDAPLTGKPISFTWHAGKYGHDTRGADNLVKVSTNVYRAISTYTLPSSNSPTVGMNADLWNLTQVFDFTKGTFLQFYKPKLEHGNKATDWSPAPEDVQQQFTDVNGELSQKVSQTTHNVLAGTVDTVSTLAKQNQSTISTLATKTSVDTVNKTATTAQTLAQQNANELLNKASSTTVNTLTQRVTTAESTLSQTATKAELALTKTDVDKLGDSVASQALDIAATADGLKLKADSSTVSDLAGTVSQNSAQLGLTATKAELALTKTDVNDLDDTVNKQATQLALTATKAELQVAQTNVDNLKKTVTSNTAGMTANANAIKLKADSSTVSSLDGRVTSLSGQLDVQADKIAAKLTANDVAGMLNGYATQTWAQNQITATANGLDAKLSQTQTQLDGISIGGTNLLTGTSGPFVMGYGIPNTAWDTTNQVSGISLPVTAKNAEVLPQGTGFPYTWMPGVTYTQSIYISTDAPLTGTPISFTWFTHKYGHDIRGSDNLVKVSTNLYRATSTYTWPSSNSPAVYRSRNADLYNLTQVFDFTKGTFLQFYKPKLEHGNIATDWSPAPEDTATYTDTKVAELKLTVDGLSATFAKQTDLNKVTSDFKVTADGLNLLTTATGTNGEKVTQVIADVNNIKTTMTGANGVTTRLQTLEGFQNTATSNITNLQTQQTTLAGQYTSLIESADNKVRTPWFDDGQTGTWNDPSNKIVRGSNVQKLTGHSKYLKVFKRDNFEGGVGWFSVTPGEVYYFSGYMGSWGTTYPVNVGLQFITEDGNNSWIPAAGFPANSKTLISAIAGSITVPAGVVRARTLVQIDGTAGTDLGYAAISGLRISKSASSSQITQLQDNIDLRVKVDSKIAAALSLSADGGGTVTIRGASLYVTAASHFDNASIQSAAIANLDAAKITSGSISSDRLVTTKLNADNITSGSIAAARIATTALSATNITSGTFDASKMTVKNLSADLIASGTIDASKITVKNLSASNIVGGTLDAGLVNVKNLNASNITAGTIDAGNINVINLNVNSLVGDRAEFVKSAWNAISSAVTIDGSGITATHSDGSKTILNASGLYHQEGGNSYHTNYLNEIIKVSPVRNDTNNPQKVQLPAVFKGKQFKVAVSIADIYGQTSSSDYGKLALQRVVAYIKDPIDYTNAIVQLVGYARFVQLDSRAVANFDIQVNLIVTY